jgi:hypothetical protein
VISVSAFSLNSFALVFPKAIHWAKFEGESITGSNQYGCHVGLASISTSFFIGTTAPEENLELLPSDQVGGESSSGTTSRFNPILPAGIMLIVAITLPHRILEVNFALRYAKFEVFSSYRREIDLLIFW